MNKLAIPNGGMPLDGDDFEWIHSGLLEAFKGVMFPFIQRYGGNAILSGCNISFTGGLATVTEGFVAIGYEVCYCPAQTVAVTSLAASSLKVVETYDVSGLEIFADSVSRDTYMRRRAAISDGLIGGNEIVLENASRVQGEVVVSSLLNDWTVDAGSTVKAKIFNGMVDLEGVIVGGRTNNHIMVLPEGYRPAEDIRFAGMNNFDLESTIMFIVFANGTVGVYNEGGEADYTASQKVFLNGIRFSV